MIYNKTEIIKMLESAKNDMSTLYKQDFINYRGKTQSGELYSEIICEWLLKNINLLKNISEITRKSPYNTEGHDGIPSTSNSNREEELIAMAMFRQKQFDAIGVIIDYQTPLKNKKTDKAGKIDLLSYDKNTKILRILELKKPDSKETMLRCVLEGYTYLLTVDKDKLKENFKIDRSAQVVASPFVFYDREQYKEMNEDRPYLKELMKKLNSTPFYIEEISACEKYKVKDEENVKKTRL